MSPNKLLLRRLHWPQHIADLFVTNKNPGGTLTNLDLELAGGLLLLEALAQTFGIQEHTVLCKTGNFNVLLLQQTGSATTDKVRAHLLCLFVIHQLFHRYILWHSYIARPSNLVADVLSCDFVLARSKLMSTFENHFLSISG